MQVDDVPKGRVCLYYQRQRSRHACIGIILIPNTDIACVLETKYDRVLTTWSPYTMGAFSVIRVQYVQYNMKRNVET